jgi:hypothetical protein
VFDLGDHLDDLRCRPTEWLRERRDELVREQRRLRVEELAVTRVLDERGALDEALAARDGVSERTARETVETARALESLPWVADAAHRGELSNEQLGHVARIADETSDAEWAHRAPQVAPVDLARIARTLEKPTMEQAAARRRARRVCMWWSDDQTMLHIRGVLADLDGARFEATINRMVEAMRPPNGQPCPRSWGGTDDPANLAAVCRSAGHHQMLIPTGPWALVGNPNRPDGLRLVRYHDLTDDEARRHGPPPPRGSP